MLITLQGNIGPNLTTPIQMDFNDLIYCNEGGKANMSLAYKNIPPMEHNDIPSEIQIRNSAESNAYSKIPSYNKAAWLSGMNLDEIPPFRFQIIYDGYDFLYYPEFKVYERPYLLLEYDTSLGTSSVIFNKEGINDAKNLAFLANGETLWLKDYNVSYTIVSITETTTM